MYKYAIPTLAFLLAGCGEKPAAPVPTTGKSAAPHKISLRLASPDQTIKTWWNIRDLEEIENKERCETRPVAEEDESEKYGKTISIGAALASYDMSPPKCRADIYSRDIIEVKVESETRAVVLARIKPATPVPEGVSLAASQEKERSEGALYRYVLEKVDSEWKIEQMYRRSDYGDNAWRPVFEGNAPESAHTFVYGPQ